MTYLRQWDEWRHIDVSTSSRRHAPARYTTTTATLDPLWRIALHKLEYISYIIYRVGKYKLIQGSPGIFNDWTPVPNWADDSGETKSSGPQQFPPYQLFDLEGK